MAEQGLQLCVPSLQIHGSALGTHICTEILTFPQTNQLSIASFKNLRQIKHIIIVRASKGLILWI